MSDKVNNPSHYTSHPSGVECIELTEYLNFNRGNALKYVNSLIEEIYRNDVR